MEQATATASEEEARRGNNRRDLPKDFLYLLVAVAGFFLSVTGHGSSFAHLTPLGETGAMAFGSMGAQKIAALLLKSRGRYYYLFSSSRNELPVRSFLGLPLHRG